MLVFIIDEHITCLYMAIDDQWHYKQCIPYNLNYELFFGNFFKLQSVFVQLWEFNVVESMNRPWRLILYIAYMFCYFRFFFIEELLLFLLLAFFFSIVLTHFFVHDIQAFERVVQNEEFNLKIKFFFCPCRGSFLSFSFLITLLISLHSWMYSVKWLVRCIYWK